MSKSEIGPGGSWIVVCHMKGNTKSLSVDVPQGFYIPEMFGTRLGKNL